MAKKNENFDKLPLNYLFPEIQRKKQAYLNTFPDSQLISLGIGDTTQPLPESITGAICETSKAFSTLKGYRGYGAEQGLSALRQMIAKTFYNELVEPDEIFISDGAKCDTGRLLQLFAKGQTIAVQDPSYPVYVDTSVISGLANKIHFMPCLPDNDFFPNLDINENIDLIFFCSPNNPTGAVASKKQLEQLVAFALERNALIIFDAAYSFFIKDEHPRSIYEIKNADQVAIEINSFSKMAGFTGLRLGWSIIPKNLKFDDGSSIHQAWNRITTTFFNGASYLTQMGGVAALQTQGMKELAKTRDFYLKNAHLIKETLKNLRIDAYGGTNCPFVWADFSPKTSWEMFDELLYNTQTVTIPGSGFGASGEGFLRLSAFAQRKDILDALERISKYFLRVKIS